MKNFLKNSFHSQQVFYRYFRKKGFKRFLKENILESDGSNKTKAQSIALGVFIGISPFWGFHSFLAISLSVFFRLNKFLTFISSQITFPPLIPLIIFASMIIGDPFVEGKTDFATMEFNMETVKNNLLQYFIGSLILSTVGGIIFGAASYMFLSWFSPEKKKITATTYNCLKTNNPNSKPIDFPLKIIIFAHLKFKAETELDEEVYRI